MAASQTDPLEASLPHGRKDSPGFDLDQDSVTGRVFARRRRRSLNSV